MVASVTQQDIEETCDQLSDTELTCAYMAGLIKTNPKNLRCYDKIAGLLSEEDGTRIHPTTLEALGAIWERRCGKRSEPMAAQIGDSAFYYTHSIC